METFPISQLPTPLLVEVISKLFWKSYLGLQQTCRTMRDLARSNRSIMVEMNEVLYWKRKWKVVENQYDLPMPHQVFYWHLDNGKRLNLDCLTGVRFSYIVTPPHDKRLFEVYCNTFERHRITSHYLDFYPTSYFSREQCLEWLTILKPDNVVMYSEGSNRFESLLQIGGLVGVSVHLHPDDVLFAIKELLPRFRYVKIFQQIEDETTDHFFLTIDSILQFLRSEDLPNLCEFNFTASWQGECPSIDEQLENLFFLVPIVETRGSTTYLSIPAHKGVCKLWMEDQYGTISYTPTDH